MSIYISIEHNFKHSIIACLYFSFKFLGEQFVLKTDSTCLKMCENCFVRIKVKSILTRVE